MPNVNPLRAGIVRGEQPAFEMGCEASQVFAAWSGRFVKRGSNGYAQVAGDGDTELVGWMEADPGTVSSTAATAYATKYPVHSSLSEQFMLPLRYDNATYTQNYAETLIGKTCDLVIVSNVQYANLTTSTEDTIIIVGGKAASSATANDGYVIVKLNPVKMGATGVA